MRFKGKKVLVTGGAGFIGSHLAEKLLKRGDEITIIDNLSTGSINNISHLMHNPSFDYVIDTIMNQGLMSWLIRKCDIVYHLAAAVGVKLIVEKPIDVIFTNIIGTEIVLRLASKENKKVLITSTSEIYGKSEKIPYSENDDRVLGPTTKSRWSYSSSKAVDEYMALSYFKQKKLDVIITRLFNTIGPKQTGMYGMVIPRFVNQALHNEPITVYGDGKQTRTFCHVKDTIGALIALTQNPKASGEIFNIGSEEEISIKNLAKLVKEITNSKSKIIHIPYDEAYEVGFEDMKHRVPDISKIKKFIGYEPKTNLKEALISISKYLKKTL
ncbi:GDP-mannose 4,6-dehydratase [candidate division WOR-3 bacterium]|nr:GDP-mannose 4,6-dehydratase [candidate division WOR-3 bacterium]